jgi:3-hydroxyacyl-[acyl-carrier-protein] dehydratase
MTSAVPEIGRLDFEQVRQMLPQRFPLILIDRVAELEPGLRIVAIKNVTGNELQFLGHFPGRAVMPGVLIIEAAAQAVILMCRAGQPQTRDSSPGFLANANISFRVPVTPGDQMVIEAGRVRRMGNLLIAKVRVLVTDRLVASGELTLSNRSEAAAAC